MDIATKVNRDFQDQDKASAKNLFCKKEHQREETYCFTFISVYLFNKYGRNAGRIKIKNQNSF